jgi:hypothetical protein
MKKPITVTFDTNVANLIGDPVRYADRDRPPGTAERIRCAIKASEIVGFVSEASVFVECLSFPDKLAYLAVAGRQGPRPTPDPDRVAVFEKLSRLGVRLLHAPLSGVETFINVGMPWAADENFSANDRHLRFSSFGRTYPRHKPLKDLGEKSLNAKPLKKRLAGMPAGMVLKGPFDWTLALKRDWDEADEKQRTSLRNKTLGPLFSEWCDTLIVGSHYGYGNEYFCTMDSGKRAGSGSLLHNSHRGILANQGIKIVSPSELATILGPFPRTCRIFRWWYSWRGVVVLTLIVAIISGICLWAKQN